MWVYLNNCFRYTSLPSQQHNISQDLEDNKNISSFFSLRHWVVFQKEYIQAKFIDDRLEIIFEEMKQNLPLSFDWNKLLILRQSHELSYKFVSAWKWKNFINRSPIKMLFHRYSSDYEKNITDKRNEKNALKCVANWKWRNCIHRKPLKSICDINTKCNRALLSSKSLIFQNWVNHWDPNCHSIFWTTISVYLKF